MVQNSTNNQNITSKDKQTTTNLTKFNYNIGESKNTLKPSEQTLGGKNAMVAKFTPMSKNPNIPTPPSSNSNVKMLPIPPMKGGSNSQVKSGVLSGNQGSQVPIFSSVNNSETSHIGAVSSVLGVMEN
jgi:hypothetical protein